jgi:hypothetical protein
MVGQSKPANAHPNGTFRLQALAAMIQGVSLPNDGKHISIHIDPDGFPSKARQVKFH